ncbi:MAG: hypothetical protein K8I82_21945, partial [Anaerolineae bacterium]|nr:hypothetical protein [Anaerolineae bacterium]
RLAYYELALFKNQQQEINILPENYRAGSPVILETPSRWMNAYLQHWYLPREAPLFHIAPEAALSAPITPIVAGYGEETTRLLDDFLGESETVWYVRTREMTDTGAYETLTQLGYLPTVIPSGDFRYNTELFVVRYEHQPDEFAEQERFGDFLSLQHIAFSDENFASCQTVTVKSWWKTDSIPTANYGLHFQLVDSEQNLLVETARGLTPVPTLLWSPEQYYLDERSLTLPCDLPAGEYHLRFFIQNPDTGEFLPSENQGVIASFNPVSD